MTRRNDRRVREALRDFPAPGEGQAEERGWAVVREVFTEREPAPSRIPSGPRAAVAVLAAGLVAAFALSPAGADVRGWIADAIEPGVENAQPAPAPLPTPGSLLVETGDGVWVVRSDGSKRRLGDYAQGTWSPRGLYVGVTTSTEVLAVDPLGEVRWTQPAARPSAPAWSTGDGDRVAYLSAKGDLHVIAGDGTGDRVLDSTVRPVAPAWRPDLSEAKLIRELAYVSGDGQVRAVDTETGEPLFETTPPKRLKHIEWMGNGKGLLMAGPSSLRLRLSAEQTMGWGPMEGRWTHAAIAPRGYRIAAVSRSRGRSGIQILRQSSRDQLISVPSRVRDVTWSPDGEWILAGLSDANQWLFIRVRDGKLRPLSNVSQQFDDGTAAFPRVAGWCC